MTKDITKILGNWEFDPDHVSVRMVPGDDGREKLQLRLDLGLLQLEVDGRPDGRRPNDCESWLDYYEKEQRLSERKNPDAAPFALESEDCVHLLREGIQYYHRYLSFWHLERFEQCARDTARNLRLFAFVRLHAREGRDKLQFDQWRPYVTLMHTRSVATPLIRKQDHPEALKVIELGIEGIWEFLREYDQTERASSCHELGQLEQWKEHIEAQLSGQETPSVDEPTEPVDLLRKQLDEAVIEERYEDAARLRDQIRRL